MPSLTPKLIDGHTYYYARYTQRVGGKPKVVRTVYLGKIEDLVAGAEGSRQPPPPLETEVAAFGDVAALLHIAQRLDLVPLLDSILPPDPAWLSSQHFWNHIDCITEDHIVQFERLLTRRLSERFQLDLRGLIY